MAECLLCDVKWEKPLKHRISAMISTLRKSLKGNVSKVTVRLWEIDVISLNYACDS